jgi:hypothetical protein
MGGDVEVDGAGGIIITGMNFSGGFPLVDPVQLRPSCNGDIFVARLAPGGGSLTFTTLLGGCLEDTPQGLAVHPAGDVIVAGVTESPDFPTVNAVQGSKPDWDPYDAFVFRLQPAGSMTIPVDFTCGDCDGNGQVDILDALLASQIDVGLEHDTGCRAPRCLVHGSGGTPILAALLLAQHAVGLPVTLDCGCE